MKKKFLNLKEIHCALINKVKLNKVLLGFLKFSIQKKPPKY